MKLISSRSSRGKKYKAKKKNKGLSAVIALCAVLLLAIAAFVAYVIYGAANCDGILPNVSAYGIPLGGMSVTEAEDAIRSELEAPGSGVSLVFPNGTAMELSRADATAGYDAKAAAEAAWSYGRTEWGSVSPLRYAFSLSGSAELYSGFDSIDDGALKAAIAEKSADINSTLVEGAYSVSGSTLTIIKGMTGILIDEDEVYRIAKAAFESGEKTADYTPLESAPQPLSVADIHAMIFREAHNAEFDSEFNVIESVDGLSFDLERAKALYDAADEGAVISVTLDTVEPEVTTEELSSLLYRDKLSEWTSDLTDNEVRSKNIELAANELNGLVLLPGEEFSFNDAVGKRTTERGFGAAPAYSGGRTVYAVGGGICQVSSSIYYCCLIADMDIVYRTCHLYASSYIPLGMDATVSWGGPDYKFSNSSEYPIKIQTWRDGDQLFCEIYGTKTTDEYIEMTYEINTTYNYATKYREDASVSPGRTKTNTYGMTGYKVTTYKARYAGDGTLISREKEDTSVYSKRDQVILVAPGELHLYDPSAKPPAAEPTPTPAPSAAPAPAPEIDPASNGDLYFG